MEGEAEIGHFGPVILGDQDVSRGEVTVEDLLLLQVLHPLASVPNKTEIKNKDLSFTSVYHAPHSLCEFDLILPRDVLSAPGAKVLQQATLGHVLRHDLVGLVVNDDSEEADKIFVLKRPGREENSLGNMKIQLSAS